MKIKDILKKQINLISPEKEKIKEIEILAKDFCNELVLRLEKKKIYADVFVGGSLAKGTMIKKDRYDVDIFVRFDKKYAKEDISKILGRVIGKAKKVHGSRDYYQIENKDVTLEVIPVIKINKPEEALNVTDLSYFHVNYLLKEIRRNKNIIDEIKLIKSFVHAQGCYGAESYINGFSGYALELLICHYGSFEKFLKEVINSNVKDKKIIIDDKKFYRKNQIVMEMNESKINSPIVLIDPTFKERNACAGLSYDTFFKFREKCKEFINNPSTDFFIEKNIEKEMINRYKDKLNILEVKTTKQAGDIAGTKSKKFLEFFIYRLKKEFNIHISNFEYSDKKNVAKFYFVLDNKKEELIRGPPIKMSDMFNKFKKMHKGIIIKNNIAYAKLKHNSSFKEFLKIFLKKDKKIISEMSIKEIKIIK